MDKLNLYDAVANSDDSGGGRPADPLDLFDDFVPAGPIPAGTYEAVATGGKLIQSGRGTPGFRLEYRLTAPGKHCGRRVWGTLWLSEAALPRSKPALAQFGFTKLIQLKAPFPAEKFLCKVKVAMRSDDDGFVSNEVTDVLVIGQQELPADPFAPAPPEGLAC